MANFSNKLRGLIIEQLVSHPDPRSRARARKFGLTRLSRKPPTLELYFEPGDPHSHLALQALSRFAERLHCPIALRVVPPPAAEFYPEPERQRQFALEDAKLIAPAYGLSFPANATLPDDQQRQRAATHFCSYANDLYQFLAVEAEWREALFNGQALPAHLDSADCRAQAQSQLSQNAKRRQKMGHYLPAMWQFDGEWFWGIDRMDFLQQRLLAWGALEDGQPLLASPKLSHDQPAAHADSLDFYFSFRSPYSYLAAQRLLSEQADWPLPFNIKPVLPMAMRGLAVPTAKRLYIARDVKRCADRDGIPFGRIADPIGAGAERALTVFNLCQDRNQQLQFIAAASRAAFAEATDLATDAGLLHASRQAGLSDTAVLAKLKQGMDLALAEENRQALFNMGLWGVPSWQLGEFKTWGYDRLWAVKDVLALNRRR